MSEWWREAAWMVLPDGTAWIHPQTRTDRHADGSVTLTAHKVANYSVTLPAAHPLAAAVSGVAGNPEGNSE